MSPLKRRRRISRGFTLIELMITVGMVSILASFVMMAVFVAQEQAKKSQTKGQIAKLNQLLMRQWDSYRTRRVPLDLRAELSVRDAAIKRLQAIRELQRLEMPDRWNDVKTGDPGTEIVPLTGIPLPTLSRAYFDYYTSISPTDIYQSAECLYMIVKLGNFDDGAGIDFFNESEVGDIDGDGAPEFHDAWGNPIMFIRWAPGFVSNTGNSEIGFVSNLHDTDTTSSHDPFDPRLTDTDAFALYPVIYSAGPDGKTNATQATGYDIELASSFIHGVGIDPDFYDPYVNPSDAGGDPAAEHMGRPVDPDGNGREHYDNIHNHMLDD